LADSKRQLIMDAVVARLVTIQGLSPYSTSVGQNIFEWREHPLTEGELPGIIVRDTDTITSLTHSRSQHVMRVEFEAFVAGAAAPRDFRNVLGDIQRAIGQDTTWGGLAEQTLFVAESLQADTESRRLISVLSFWDITFLTDYNNPET
jgi:hypothetical protein